MTTAAFLAKTIELMSAFSIPVRDTFRADSNLDDFYSSGNCYGGPRLFDVEWAVTDGFPQVKANRKYEINGFQSVAYDNYKIVMPERYKTNGRDDPIIHECVHFLQCNTTNEDNNYIQFTGDNYLQYASQRVELEAHIVQIAYIIREKTAYCDAVMDKTKQLQVIDMLSRCQPTINTRSAIQAVVTCKNGGLI